MPASWLWLPRTNGEFICVNLANVTHIDPAISPPPGTTHICFSGLDDNLYMVEVAVSAQELLETAGIEAAAPKRVQGKFKAYWDRLFSPAAAT